MNFKNKIRVDNNTVISDKNPCFIIAEAGVNHNGNLDNGKKLVDIAADAGADAVKFQTFQAKNISRENAPRATYHIETTGSDKKQSWYELLLSQELSPKDHIALIEHCKKRNIIFLSTPYDEQSVDLLVDLGTPIIKIASTDSNNHKLLSYIGSKKVSVILSTAMSSIDEIKNSIGVLYYAGCRNLALLQCTGNYPTKKDDLNILAMKNIKEISNCVVGFSDHSTNINSGSIAVAAGAKVYEKHFTVSRNMDGPDHRASLEPKELKECISLIKDTEIMLGSGLKKILNCEKDNRKILRKFAVAKRNLFEGHIISENDVDFKRTGGLGCPADTYFSLIGKRIIKKINKNEIINFKNICKAEQ